MMSTPSNTDTFNSLLGGDEISNILRSEGPIVTCVLLKASSNSSEDEEKKKPVVSLESSIVKEKKPRSLETTEKKDSNDSANASGTTKSDSQINQDEKEISSLPILEDDTNISEISVDTTPKKSMVQTILGGPFTFLGQYEEEGIVLMMKRDQTLDMPRNNHKLQPPFDEVEVRGDILIMRVAEVQDDQMEVAATLNSNAEEKVENSDLPNNNEFFMNYTKDEYLKFAARTDIVVPEYSLKEEPDDNENEVENEVRSDQSVSDSEDDDFDPLDYEDNDSGEDEEDCQVGMMNLIFGQILKRFRAENGRGPDTRELLEMRKALAEKLGVDVPDVDEAGSNWDEKVEKNETKECKSAAHDGPAENTNTGVKSRKRSLESDNENNKEKKKRVKWVIEEETDDTKEQNNCRAETLNENETNETADEIVLQEGEGEI